MPCPPYSQPPACPLRLVFTESLPLGLPSVPSAKSTKFYVGDDIGRVQDTLLKIWCPGILNILSQRNLRNTRFRKDILLCPR